VRAVKKNPAASVEVIKLHPAVSVSLIELKRMIRFAIEQLKVSNAQLTFILASDKFLRRLNKKFTKRNHATDVLSFDLSSDIKKGLLLGDIVVSVDSALKASKTLGLSFKDELIRYLIHGILHLTGYDDTTVIKKKKMWKRQEELVKEAIKR